MRRLRLLLTGKVSSKANLSGNKIRFLALPLARLPQNWLRENFKSLPLLPSLRLAAKILVESESKITIVVELRRGLALNLMNPSPKKILVVDDNPVDRHLIGSILGKVDDWQLDFATDGASALSALESNTPDLVVTDMQMPYLDGLELVKGIREQHASLPVVLITSHGSEKTAVEALKCGAASYSPKSSLNTDLVRTIRQVLQMSEHVQASTVPTSQPVPKNFAYVLNNDLSLIGPLIENLQTALPSWSDKDRLQIGMAIDEALVNAMHHGNLEVNSDLRDSDESKYYEQIKDRRLEKPFCERRVSIQAEFSSQHVCIQISDEGPGFDPSKIEDPTTDDNVQRIGGRGLFLIKAFMSHVSHNVCGNQITMTKLRKTD